MVPIVLLLLLLIVPLLLVREARVTALALYVRKLVGVMLLLILLVPIVGSAGILCLPLGDNSFAYFAKIKVIQLLRTQDSAPSPDQHVTVGRSRDSLTPNGSRAPLGKQSPDKSRDLARSLVATPSRGDTRRVYKAKEIYTTALADRIMQTVMAKGRS